MAGFKAAIDAYTAAVAATLEGGKSATVDRDKRRADVTTMLRLLGHYVEGACKNDLTTFVSSGFVAASTGQRTPAQPVSIPSVAVDQGSNSGQLVVTQLDNDSGRHSETRNSTFQVRAFGKLGFSDWSDSVNRMCISCPVS